MQNIINFIPRKGVTWENKMNCGEKALPWLSSDAEFWTETKRKKISCGLSLLCWFKAIVCLYIFWVCLLTHQPAVWNVSPVPNQPDIIGEAIAKMCAKTCPQLRIHPAAACSSNADTQCWFYRQICSWRCKRTQKPDSGWGSYYVAQHG